MDIQNRRALKQEAAEALIRAPEEKKIITLYTGVSLLLALAVVLISELLGAQVEKTSGLDNIGTRVILETVIAVLPAIQFVVLIFWDYGYMGTVLRISRGQAAGPRDIANGFYRVGPIFRLSILQYLITLGLSLVSIYLSSMVFLFTPFAGGLMDAITPLVTETIPSTDALIADPGVAAALTDAWLPVMGIFLVVYCLLVLPILYMFRMAVYCLLDNPRAGAIAALRDSRNMMRRNRMKLLKLDLSFWWYYLLMMLPVLICYGDVLLPALGVTLPFGESGNYILFYCLYCVAHFIFCYFLQNRVEVTYARAYEALKPKPLENSIVLGNIFQM